jgi:hypothetical protein
MADEEGRERGPDRRTGSADRRLSFRRAKGYADRRKLISPDELPAELRQVRVGPTDRRGGPSRRIGMDDRRIGPVDRREPEKAARTAADVHRLFATAFNVGDLDRLMELFDARGCCVSRLSPTAIGADAIRNKYEILLRGRPDLVVEVQQIIPCGEDFAVVLISFDSASHPSLDGVAADVVCRQPDQTWRLMVCNIAE